MAYSCDNEVLIIVKDGAAYRFTDIIKAGEHYLAHQIRDDNTVGKMEHRITQQETVPNFV